MPSPSRFPVKRRKVKPYALQREGRPASEAGWRRAAWGGGGLQPGQQEAVPSGGPTTRQRRPDDRCAPAHPRGHILCPPGHQIPGWLQGHHN
ncbi:unnamed protein product [Rangifer tarandus platyrhynchus]|uniref:Uncharacterized protein n=1 Tax=Rangifer tarandus platyrhynchus TaxID=3082113 RepID=A0ABN8ZWD4_RANTA|nr:unnamed protein product [Rangifer tarandus platyrhynchus]